VNNFTYKLDYYARTRSIPISQNRPEFAAETSLKNHVQILLVFERLVHST